MTETTPATSTTTRTGRRRVDVLIAIASSVKARGYAPTLLEVCQLLGLRSTHAVFDDIKKLERDGLIVRGGRKKWRNTNLTRAGQALLEPPDPFREELAIEALDL